MLLADDDKQPRVSLSKPVESLVVGECRADEHDVIKLAKEGAAELVYEKLMTSPCNIIYPFLVMAPTGK